MVGVFFPQHESPPFQRTDRMGYVTRIKHSRIPEFGLTQSTEAGERREAAILISVNPRTGQVLMQGLMRARGGRTENPGWE